MKHWRILFYFSFNPLFLHVSIALTVISSFSACLFDFCVGLINLGILAWRLNPAAVGSPDPRSYCLVLDQIQRPPRNRLRCHFQYLRPHSSWVYLQCPNCFQVRFPHHFRLDDGWFFGFGKHSIFEFILQGGPLQSKVVAMEIFLTIWMQPDNHVERVNRMLWQSLLCPKFIARQSSGCHEREIPSG